MFLVSDDRGDVLLNNGRGFGLYYLDTRYLSFLEFRVNDRRPDLLTASSEHNYFGNIQLTNPRFLVLGEFGETEEIAPQTVSIRRNRFIDGALHERVVFFNYNKSPIDLSVSLSFAADFRDVFDVRGYYQGERGEVLTPTLDGEPFTSSVNRVATLQYIGRDGAHRRTILSFEMPREAKHLRLSVLKGGRRHRTDRTKLPELEPAPSGVEVEPPGIRMRFRLRLEPQQSSSFIYYVQPTVDRVHPERPRARFDLAAASIARAYQEDWFADCARITTSDGVFDRMLDRGKVDIRALLGVYGRNRMPFAGIPWYSAPFGRDSLITAYQVLMLNPEVALGALRFLAERQGNEDSAWRDEEPGKVLHEIRYGELSNLALVPHLAYYGTADATPLFLVLFCEVMDWLDDDALFDELWPNAERALEWIDRWGDRDGDGLVEYASRSSEGLRNQTWKDSWDAYQYADGRLAEPPIAAIEVQGYVYDAKLRLARLLRRKRPALAARADELEQQAAALRALVESRFWMPSERYYAIGLGPNKEWIDTVTSNPGHLLWSGALDPERARLVAQRLTSRDMSSGWGVRTLSSLARGFNPMGYHLGTVWPHDNSIVAAGLKRYGFDAEANGIISDVFDASQHFRYFRLPELYCGFERDRRTRATPAEYPVSCSPQSWAAGSAFLFIQTMLGLRVDAANRVVRLRPTLPDWLRFVSVEDMRVGSGRDHVSFWVERGAERAGIVGHVVHEGAVPEGWRIEQESPIGGES